MKFVLVRLRLFKNPRHARRFGSGLAGVYLFLYITLRQQDYALLMGAIALFVVLAIVMYVTRKVDWYARDSS